MFNLFPENPKTKKRTVSNTTDETRVQKQRLLSFSSNVGSTCDLGIQTVVLTPGGSSTCGHSGSCCSTSCCW